jgi:PAS domain S-box-containing protein
MSTKPEFLPQLTLPTQLPWYLSPKWQLIMLGVIIFSAETIAMVVVYLVPFTSYLAEILFDGFIMLLLISPGLYLLQMRPILKHMEERKEAEDALQESEKLLRNVMESLPVGVWIIDGKGKALKGNPAAQAIWGGERYLGFDQYRGYKGWMADTGKRIAPDEWAALRAIARGETTLNEEINIETVDGTRKIILNSAIPIWNERGDIQSAVAIDQDITQRREKEKALIQTHELLERVFASIDTLIAYMDKDFNFVRVNETYAKSAGHPVEYFIGRNHFELYPHPENETIFRSVVETGAPFAVFEKPFSNPEFPETGMTYWDWSVQPVKGGGGVVEGIVLSLVDVTERKRAEIQLERQNEELRALSELEHRQRELAESLVQSTIALSSSLQLEEVLDMILGQIHRAIPFQMADVTLIEEGAVSVVGHLAVVEHPQATAALNRPYTLESVPIWLKIYTEQQSIFIVDTSDSPGWKTAPGMEWVRSYVGAPLIVTGQVIGFINLTSDQPGAFGEEMSALLTAFAVPAALAIHNARLFKAESTARQVAETLSATAQALTKTLDLEQVVNTLLDHIQMLVSFDTAGLTLLEDETRLVVRARRGFGRWANEDPIPSFPIDGITDSVIHRMLAARKSIALPSMPSNSYPGQGNGHELTFTWLLVPILASDNVIGLVELGRASGESFDGKHIRWAEALVGQAAVAIQNAWLFQQVVSSSERLQSLARKLVEIQENERYHIARELHDEAGQALSSLKLSLGRLEQDPSCPQHMRASLEELKGTTDGVLEELHRLAVDLRPITLDHLGLVAALEQYANKLNSDRLAVQFKALGFDGIRLTRDLETCLYRIVQEALANVMRHAQANNVGILLERVEGRVKLFVEDDGVGFDPELSETRGRLGLVGMRERADMVGGTLTVESYPGSGTSIIVDVPDADTDLNRG